MPLRHTVHQIILRSGAKGVIIDVPGTTAVNYEFSFRAGYDYVARPEIQQVAHLLEHMAFGPNAQFDSAEAYSREFGRNGAENNATTNDTSVNYYGESALMELDRILELWRIGLTTPRFNEELLRVERENIREELEAALADEDTALSQRVGRATGSKSLLTEEALATLDVITLGDVTEHYWRTHTSENMRFVIVGALADRIDDIRQQLDAWELPRGERLPLARGSVHRGAPVSLYREHMTIYSFNLSMMLGREFTMAECDAMAALNYILTGTMHSRIYGEARTRGICYGMGAGFWAYKDDTSEWTFTGRVSDRNAQALYTLISDRLREVARDGVTPIELDDAKQSARGRFQLAGQTPSEIGDAYSGFVFHDEPALVFDEWLERVDAVTNETIIRLAREFISAEAWAFGEAGPVTEDTTRTHEQVMAHIFAPHKSEVY